MNRIKKSAGEQAFDICNVLLQLIVAVIMVYPMLYVVFSSLSEPVAFVGHKGMLWHSIGFTLDSYKAALKHPMLLQGYANTLFILTFGVSINIMLTTFGAYFLSRRNVRYQKIISIYIIITMFINGGMIPFYFVVRGVGLENSLWSLILPTAVNTFNLMILRVSFASVPASLEESAKIDGAGHLTIMFKIIIPVSKASIAVIILYYAVGHWNAWFNAMLFLNEREKYPLQLILREILISNDTASMTSGGAVGDLEYMGETIKYAIIIISTAPILCRYPFVQKYFTKGVMIGAVKG